MSSIIQLQFRRGPASQWTSVNPVLADGELAIESDTRQFKIGNGVTTWNSLAYGGLVGPAGAPGTISNIVNYDMSFNANIFVGGDTSLNGRLKVSNDASFNSNLYVGKDVSLGGNLIANKIGIGKVPNPTYGLDVVGGINMTGGLYVNGNPFSSFNANDDLNLNANLFVSKDASVNGKLYVGSVTTMGGDVSMNSNLVVGNALTVNGYVSTDALIQRYINVVSSSGTYTADFNNGTTIYINAFSGSSTPTLAITNLPVVANQSYVFTVVYSGAATSTYFNTLSINGVSVPLAGSVSLVGTATYYVHQFYVFLKDTVTLGNNLVIQYFTSSSNPVLTSPIINGDVSLNGRLFVGGDVSLGSNLVVTKQVGIGKTPAANYQLDVLGNINLSGALSLNGSPFTTFNNSADLSLNANLFVGKDASLSGKLYVLGDVSFNGNLRGVAVNADGNLTVNGNSRFARDVSMNANLFIGADSSFSGKLYVASDVSFNSILRVARDISFGGNIYGVGNARINATTASTSTLTGALTVAGGAGISGNLYVGSNVNIAGNFIAPLSINYNPNVITGNNMIGYTVENILSTILLSTSGNYYNIGNITINQPGIYNSYINIDLSCSGASNPVVNYRNFWLSEISAPTAGNAEPYKTFKYLTSFDDTVGSNSLRNSIIISGILSVTTVPKIFYVNGRVIWSAGAPNPSANAYYTCTKIA